MKMRKKEIGFLISFIILVLGITGFLVYHYTEWYETSAAERQMLIAENEKRQREAAKKEKEEKKTEAAPEKEQSEETQVAVDSEQSALEKVQLDGALMNFRSVYQTQLNEYQASKRFEYSSDDYFIYDIDGNGVPELFITMPEMEEQSLRDFKIYMFDLESQAIKELKQPSRCSLLEFYRDDSGIVLSCLDRRGAVCYKKYTLKDGSLSEQNMDYFYLDDEGGVWKGGKGTYEDYCKRFLKFHDNFEDGIKRVKGYRFGDTTPFDDFESGRKARKAVRSIQGMDSLNSYEYTGDLYFEPTSAQNMGTYYRIAGGLSETMFIPARRLRNVSVGDEISLESVKYEVTLIEDGKIYLARAGVYLSRTMEESANSGFYGEIPRGYYQVFNNDGTPYYHEMVGNIVLRFYNGAAVSTLVSDELGQKVPYYEDVVSSFQTDDTGRILDAGPRGRICVENNLVVSYEEMP